MKPNEPQRTSKKRAANKSVNDSTQSPNPHNSPNKHTGCSPVTDTVINGSDRHRPEWLYAGRVACRQGRKLTPHPWGITGLTLEGLIRAENWVAGWSAEANEIGKKCERATRALQPL